ncbi:MAG: hypothetical protein RL391_1832, partial [Actinomycetota bacterium]
MLATLASFGVARAVALPEVCAATTSEQRRSAVSEGVGWIVRNQGVDGRFLYRYDARSDSVSTEYSWVRHAGTMFALAQVISSGLDVDGSAERSFESALGAIREQIVWSDDRRAAGVDDGFRVTTGGTALLLLAITERGVPDVELADSLASHLIDSIDVDRIDGLRVLETADRELRFHPTVVGRFTTSEVAFALARMEKLQPGRGWADPLPGIFDYLARHKAQVEGFVPDMADHWAAYALAEITKWSTESSDFDRAPLDGWIRKQLGITSVMIRYESQRTNEGLDRWLRGRTSVGSAIGTHGESMTNWFAVAQAGEELRGSLSGIRDRVACNASVLVERQVSADESTRYAEPDRVRGSWLWFEQTQVDDQQHAISALVGAEKLLSTSDVTPRRDALPGSWLLVALSVVLAVNPAVVARASRRCSRIPAVRLGVLSVALVVFGDRLLDLLDVSVPTAVVAAGVAMTLNALVGLVPRVVPPGPSAAYANAGLVVLLVAAGAGDREWSAILGAILALWTTNSLRERRSDSWSRIMWAIFAVVAGIALIVNGV